jgi:hypothetical protein
MEKSFVEAWDANKGKIRTVFEKGHPEGYRTVVAAVVQMLNGCVGGYRKPDPERIHEIDDGGYQGTLVYVIGSTGYHPDKYWYVKVGYGSCSGCDTLESIRGYMDGAPTEEQIADYMTLALHVVQNLRLMNGGDQPETVEPYVAS